MTMTGASVTARTTEARQPGSAAKSADRGADGSELELQRRWAEGRWPAPWLTPEQGGAPLRVHFAGRWNRAAGPDFRGAILLDGAGRARRGDVELHRRPAGWRSHGHHRDPAYARVLLHLVGELGGARGGGRISMGEPPAALLPGASAGKPSIAAPYTPPYSPPCERVIERAGAAAVTARLRRLARERLRRKAAQLAHRRAELHAEFDDPAAADELLSAWALARALGMPRNAELLAGALEAAWRDAAHDTARHAVSTESTALHNESPRAGGWSAALHAQLLETLAEPVLLGADRWRTGRGGLGRPAGAAEALNALLARWRGVGAAESCLRLAALEPNAAVERLRLPGQIGAGRARQLLADGIYPAALALGASDALAAAIERRWLELPETRYLRTAALRGRLDAARRPDAPKRRHGEAQALLELERGWCAQGACAVCPLGRLAREGPRPAALIPSLNIHPTSQLGRCARLSEARAPQRVPAEKTASPEVLNTSNSSAALARSRR